LADCDTWGEPESEWHKSWKDNFPKEQQEVIIENHRADIKCKDNIVIELQNSSISPDDICDRERFYDKMIWLINGETLGKNFIINDKISYFTFSWKNPPQSFFYANKPIYIDIEKRILDLNDLIEDAYKRLKLIYEELYDLVGKPNDFNFEKFEYEHNLTPKELNIKKVYKVWSSLSKEISKLEKERDKLKPNSIFIIKKLYKDIPCGGWGYLITKEDFLKRFK
jgi:hypothetical protein